MHHGLTDVPGLKVGHWTNLEAATGCTVVLCPAGAVAGVDVRGTAPGTRETDLLDRYRRWASQGQLNVRVFCITTPAGGGNADQFLSRIPQMKVFQGDQWVDHIAFGENFGPGLSDPMFRHRGETRPEQLAEWRRIVTEVAKAGLPLHVHTNFTETIDAFISASGNDLSAGAATAHIWYTRLP